MVIGRREPARGQPPHDAVLHDRRPLHRDRFFRQQPLHARPAHAVHGLGHHVQRRLGLPGRYARLHLGLGPRIPHAPLVAALRQRGNAAHGQRPALRPAGFSATAATCSKASCALRRAATRAPFVCSVISTTPMPAPMPKHPAERTVTRNAVPDVTATRRIGTLKYGFGLNVEQEIRQRRRRVRAPGLERRENRELRLHRHRPAGNGRCFRHRRLVEAAARYRRERNHRERALRRSQTLSGARRAGLS